MQARIDDSLIVRRSPTILAAIFAGFALLLATVGIYGVMAYTVTQRTSEFGIRMALGAQQWDVLNLVFRQGIRLVAIGLAVGVAGALALGRVMESLLYGVHSSDPAILAAIGIVLLFVAALACWLPARRAARVDPMRALRAE
jgi:ABC-type antimicrobial peptide transport system permease subunit